MKEIEADSGQYEAQYIRELPDDAGQGASRPWGPSAVVNIEDLSAIPDDPGAAAPLPTLTPLAHDIASGDSTMSASHLLVALLEASGCSVAEIGRKLGRARSWVMERTSHADYPGLLREQLELIMRRKVSEIVDVEQLLDSEVLPSVQRLVTIRDTAERDGDRIKAAVEILDRARKGPKKRVADDSGQRLVIQMPVQVVGTMRQALEECGEMDLLSELRMLTQGGEAAADDGVIDIEGGSSE